MNNFKGYVYTIFSGVLLAIAVLFIALQWGNRSDVTAFGPTVQPRTIWLVLFSAIGGMLAFWLIRVFLRGVNILHKARSEQKRIVSAASKASGKSADAAAKQTKASDESDSPLGPR